MSNNKVINLVLFGLVAVLLVVSGKGGFGAGNWASVSTNLGVSLFGGLICGTALYGINILKVPSGSKAGQFLRIERNCDLGEEYWLRFIDNLDRSPETVWFCGRKQQLWINSGLVYRAHLKEKLLARVARWNADRTETGWESIIIVGSKESAAEWVKFIDEEIAPATRYRDRRPDLFRVGVVSKKGICYSIVTYSTRTVVIPYTSGGRSADSPTFEVSSQSPVAELYLEDLRQIENRIGPEDWVLGREAYETRKDGGDV